MDENVKHLVEEIQRGNSEALTQLYEACHKDVYKMALKLCRNDADARDVVQDTFLELSKSIYDLKEVNAFYLWLYRIVHSKCIKLFRKEKYFTVDNSQLASIPNMIEKDIDFLPKENSDQLQEKEVMRDFVKQLPDTYGKVVELMYFHQCSIQEVSDTLKIPVGTVKSRVHTARKKLKHMVNSYEKVEGRKISFHDFGSLGVVSIFSFQGICEMVKARIKNIPIQSVATNMVMVVSGVAVVGLSVEAGEHMVSEKKQAEVIHNTVPNTQQVVQTSFHTQYNGKDILTPKDAYFTIIDIVKNTDSISKLEPAKRQELKPLYNALKEENGIYWNLLQSQGWTTDSTL